MGIRELLNRNRTLTMGAAVIIVAGAIGMVVMQVLASRKTFPSKLPDSYFTVDDGKTFFVANSENIPPFDYKGQQAVHAYVFQCNGKKFVGFLERYSPEAHAQMLAGKRSPEIERFGREIKIPGDAQWVKTGDLAAEAKVMNRIKSPDGSGATPESVEP